jgi:hypothetical protein
LAISFYSATDIFLLVAEEAFKDSGGFGQKNRPIFVAVLILFFPRLMRCIMCGYPEAFGAPGSQPGLRLARHLSNR